MFSTKPEAFKSTCLAFWKNDAVFNNAPCFELKCICASWKVGRWLSPPPLLRTLSLQKIKSSEAFWHFRLGWGDIGKAFLSSSWKCTSGWYVPEIVRDARLRRVVLFFPWFQVFFLASWAADGVKTRLRTATSTQDYPYAWNLRWQNSRLFLCDLSHPIHFLFAFILKIWIYLFHQVQLKKPTFIHHVFNSRLLWKASCNTARIQSERPELPPRICIASGMCASPLLLMWCCHSCSLNRWVEENRIPDPACHCALSTQDSACHI